MKKGIETEKLGAAHIHTYTSELRRDRIKERGITLIALIITIVILIILVGITLKGMADSGIINLGIKSTEKYVGEIEKEKTLFDKLVSWLGGSGDEELEEPIDPDIHLASNVKIVEAGTDKDISKIIGNDKLEVTYEGNKITNVNELPVGKYNMVYNEETGAVETISEVATFSARAVEQEEPIILYVIGEEYNGEIPDISGKIGRAHV